MLTRHLAKIQKFPSPLHPAEILWSSTPSRKKYNPKLSFKKSWFQLWKRNLSILLFSCWVVSDSLWDPVQHNRLPCPSPSPRVCSNSCPLSRWCRPTISSSAALFSSCPQSFPASGSYLNEAALHIGWPRYWSFSISPSNEYSGLISFRIDSFDLVAF